MVRTVVGPYSLLRVIYTLHTHPYRSLAGEPRSQTGPETEHLPSETLDLASSAKRQFAEKFDSVHT